MVTICNKLFVSNILNYTILSAQSLGCCMAETFLGLDVRGNAYDAYFGAEVAKKLQAIAHEVCGNGVR